MILLMFLQCTTVVATDGGDDDSDEPEVVADAGADA